jgi:hypothetical protein
VKKGPLNKRANRLHHVTLPEGKTIELTDLQLRLVTLFGEGLAPREVGHALHIGAQDASNRLLQLVARKGVDRETLLAYGARIASAAKRKPA